MVPAGLFYTATHEWLKKGKDRRVTIGITDYAQNLLGDIVFIDLPAVGEKVTAKTVLSTIESIDLTSDFLAPVTGEVLEVNDELQYSPELLNQDPFGKGLIAVLELAEDADLANLLSAAEYERLIK